MSAISTYACQILLHEAVREMAEKDHISINMFV